MELRRSQDTRKISKNFGDCTTQLGATILSLTLYVLFVSNPTFHANPVAYILGLSLVSKGLDISWLFRGVERDFARLQFEYHGQTGWSHLHLLVCQICQ